MLCIQLIINVNLHYSFLTYLGWDAPQLSWVQLKPSLTYLPTKLHLSVWVRFKNKHLTRISCSCSLHPKNWTLLNHFTSVSFALSFSPFHVFISPSNPTLNIFFSFQPAVFVLSFCLFVRFPFLPSFFTFDRRLLHLFLCLQANLASD